MALPKCMLLTYGTCEKPFIKEKCPESTQSGRFNDQIKAALK